MFFILEFLSFLQDVATYLRLSLTSFAYAEDELFSDLISAHYVIISTFKYDILRPNFDLLTLHIMRICVCSCVRVCVAQ